METLPYLKIADGFKTTESIARFFIGNN